MKLSEGGPMTDKTNGTASRLKERLLQTKAHSDRDINDITQRLQHQVNELVERVTGIRQIKRQYLALGLTAGLLVGMVLGILLGMLAQSVNEDSN
jgi:tetrahydromethanopterin S-methyltransferase subunit G